MRDFNTSRIFKSSGQRSRSLWEKTFNRKVWTLTITLAVTQISVEHILQIKWLSSTLASNLRKTQSAYHAPTSPSSALVGHGRSCHLKFNHSLTLMRKGYPMIFMIWKHFVIWWKLPMISWKHFMMSRNILKDDTNFWVTTVVAIIMTPDTGIPGDGPGVFLKLIILTWSKYILSVTRVNFVLRSHNMLNEI